jgi:prephenate dehydrogenase
MTRIAGGAESIWKDIFATNAIAVADLLREASRELSAIAEELGSQQPKLERVTRLLAAARTLPKTALE